MADIRFQFLGDTSDLEAAQGRAADGFDDTGKASADFAKVAKAGLVATAAAAAAAAAAVVKLGKATLDLSVQANRYAKEAKKIGSTATDIQKVEGAFSLLTAGSISASRVIQDFGRNLADARDGTGEAASELAKLGLTAADLANLPIGDQIALVADRFGRLRDSAERSQVAMSVFGRAGRELVPALNAGGDAVREAIEQIEQSGIISNEAAAQSEALQDSVLLLSRTFDSLKREVLIPLIPVMTATADEVRKLVQAMRETGALDSFARAFTDTVLPALSSTVRVGGRVIEALALQAKGLLAVNEAAIRTGASIGLVLSGQFKEAREEFGKGKAALEEFGEAFATFGDKSDAVADGIDRVIDRARELSAVSAPSARGGGGIGGGGEGVTGGAFARAEGGVPDPYGSKKRAADEEAAQEAIRASRTKTYDLSIQQIESLASSREQATLNFGALSSNVFSAIGSFVKLAAGAEEGSIKKTSKVRTLAMRKAWATQSGLAILQAGVNVPLSISQAAAAPWPASLGFMVAAGVASGAALAGVIAKAAAGPTFHSGGVASAGDAGSAQAFAPDEFTAILRKREGVLSTQGVAAAGGPANVHALNRGEHAQTRATFIMQVNDRTTDVQHSEAIRRPDSPLAVSMSEARPRKVGAARIW